MHQQESSIILLYALTSPHYHCGTFYISPACFNQSLKVSLFIITFFPPITYISWWVIPFDPCNILIVILYHAMADVGHSDSINHTQIPITLLFLGTKTRRKKNADGPLWLYWSLLGLRHEVRHFTGKIMLLAVQFFPSFLMESVMDLWWRLQMEALTQMWM